MTDFELRNALFELSGLRSDAEPIVTLYLDTHWSDEKQRERARVFVNEAVKRGVDRHIAHPQLEAMKRTLRRVAQAAAANHGQPGEGEGQGLAVFACESLGLWRVIASPRAFRDELSVDGRAHLLQLARLADHVQPAVIVLVHGRGAQLYEVALGAIVNETSIEGPVPNRHGEGDRVRAAASPSPHGSSGGAYFERAQKNQRHVDEQLQKVYREAADVLRQVWERDRRAYIALVGTSETLGEFERLLPERLQARILTRLPRPPGKVPRGGEGKDQLVRAVLEKLLDSERKIEADQVEHAVGEALRGGLAVLGAEDVVLAVNERRVHRLMLEEDFERSGWRCRNCGALGMTHDEVCSFCRGALARVDALGEELVGRVLAEDGEVEVVAHTNRLHSYGRVAALLRQARANGLSGREGEAPRS